MLDVSDPDNSNLKRQNMCSYCDVTTLYDKFSVNNSVFKIISMIIRSAKGILMHLCYLFNL